MDKAKQEIYLAALLENIPNESIRKTLDTIKGVTQLLTLTNKYASAGNSATGSQQFVASPFENLKKQGGTYKYRFAYQPLNLERSFFPAQKENVNDKQSVTQLWADFSADFINYAVTEDIKRTAETTLNLLHKYAVTIPNPTAIHPEVSWYDYAKIKAGLAVCLYDYLNEKKSDSISIEDTDAPLLIIRADVSGIQSFIGNIASKNASKNLKGRSFYVQLLADTVLRLLLKNLGLFQGNVMYSSGGNFFIIAPNTEHVKKEFAASEELITAAIFNEHKTEISIVLGYKEVTQSQVLYGNIHEAVKDLFELEIDYKKKRKFAGLIAKRYKDFFEPSEVGGKIATDIITGEEINENEAIYFIPEDEPIPKLATSEQINFGEKLIKESTAKQIFLGHNLKDVDYLILTEERPDTQLKNDYKDHIEPCNLGLNIYTVRKDMESDFDGLRKKDRSEVITINRFNANGTGFYGFNLYGGNKVPTVKETYVNKSENEIRRAGSPLYFHEMSGNGDFKRLAVLRMDVDGLGQIFKNYIPYPEYQSDKEKGNKRPHLTFSWYASLSRNLDWFFKGYLNTLWEENTEFKNQTQIIYSGGDDLFLIGRWDLIVDFAEKIKNEFAAFTCSDSQSQDQRLTISAGISIVTDKFPIMKAAAFASEAEHSAKKHKLKTNNKVIFEKNSIDLLDVSLHWDTEYLLVKELKNELLSHISVRENFNIGIPKSILGKIKSHYLMMRQFEVLKKKNKKANPRWIWMVAYDFSRFANRQRSDHKRFINELSKKVDTGSNEIYTEIYQAKENAENEGRFLSTIGNGIFMNSYKDSEGKELLITSRYHFLELLYIAARWAELTIRSKSKIHN